MKDGNPKKPGLLHHCDQVSKGGEQNNALQTKVQKAVGYKCLFEEAVAGGGWNKHVPGKASDLV
jgi:hypothetical protein